MTNRNYSANALSTTLSSGVTAAATTIPVAATTGFPAAPFLLAIDYGTASQELVLVTTVAGLNLTATRGYDSTTAVSHSLGAVVKHVHSAIDFRDSRTHENASSGVHGLTGSVVGTTDTQALSNKDLTAGSNSFPTTLATLTGAQTLTNKTIALGSNTVSGTLAQFSTAVTDDDVCGTTAFNAHTGATVAHGATGAVVGTTNTQTLTNKTLTSPTINTPTITSPSIDTLAGVTGVGQQRYIRKTVTESVTSSTVLQNDDALTFTVAANAEYALSLFLFYDGATGLSNGISTALALPAGATVSGGKLTQTTPTSAFVVSAGSGTPIFTGDTSGPGTTWGVRLDFSVVVAGTSGSVTLQWAQETSNATATRVLAGSWATITRVA